MNSRSMVSPLSPHDTGNSTPSTTYSSTTNTSWPMSAVSYNPSSAMSGDGGSRPLWKQPRGIRSAKTSVSGTRPTQLNIVTPSTMVSPGALSAAKSAASHGRLHKRSYSASTGTPTPQTAAFPPFDSSYQDIISPLPAHQDPYAPPSPSVSTKTKMKIKPFLSKLAPGERKTSLDLSRSAAENEGLGIYTASRPTGRRVDSYGTYDSRNHTRTTSGTSQISTTTTSSHHRNGTQYVHPMRQTPRPYTPPISHSYQNSQASSELSRPDEITPTTSWQTQRPTPTSYAPLPSLKRTPPPLHIRTYSSSRLTSSSQTNLPGTPSSLRYADSFLPQDPSTMPHTARSSFDSVFKKRSRANTNTDPAMQMAAVQALRAEFNAREAAKEEKIRQAEEKVQLKVQKKREKQEESVRRKSEAQERKMGRRSAAPSEKSVPFAMDYATTTPAQMESDLEAARFDRPKRGRTKTAGSATKAVGSKWSLFWFNFKTMWLKFKKSVSGR